jgi:hypothetical protein
MISLRQAGVFGAAAALAAAAGIALASPASAETNPSCSSVTQIGSTAYATQNGATIASVKQFKGCGKNWAYTYVWESYRASHSGWDACSSIVVGNTLKDLQCGGIGQVEVWSSGADTLSDCTFALGNVDASGTTEGKTSTRC